MSTDAIEDIRQLLTSARAYAKAYATIAAPHANVQQVDGIILAIGEIGISDACAAIDRLELEATREMETR